MSLIEIKQGVSFHLGSVKGFKQLEGSMYPIENRVIVCNTLKSYPFKQRYTSCACNQVYKQFLLDYVGNVAYNQTNSKRSVSHG